MYPFVSAGHLSVSNCVTPVIDRSQMLEQVAQAGLLSYSHPGGIDFTE